VRAEAVVATLDGGDVFENDTVSRAMEVEAVVVNVCARDVAHGEVFVRAAQLHARRTHWRGDVRIREFFSGRELDVKRAENLLRVRKLAGFVFHKSPLAGLQFLRLFQWRA